MYKSDIFAGNENAFDKSKTRGTLRRKTGARSVPGDIIHKPRLFPRRMEVSTVLIGTRFVTRLFHTQHLDVKYEFRVRGNLRWCTFAAVTEIRGDCQSSFTPNSHTHHTDIPAFDDLTSTELEAEGLALLVCWRNNELAYAQNHGEGHSGPKTLRDEPSKTLPFSSLPM